MGAVSKAQLMVQSRRKQKAFDAGYRDGFNGHGDGQFVPKEWFVLRMDEKYRAGWKAGQFDRKIEGV